MTVKLPSLSVKVKTSINGNAALSVTGGDYTALSNSINFQKTVGPYTTANADSAALGADEMYSAVTIVNPGTGWDFDLQNFTDFMNQATASLVRVKTYIIRLLSLADDSVEGTACSGIAVNGPVPAPTLAAPVVSGSGGTLAANTYYYIVTSTTAAGESVLTTTGANNQVSATTTGSTSEVTLNWTQATDATGYKVYRSTTSQTYGASSLLTTVSSGSTVTYTDTGGSTGSGQPPTVNGATVASLNTLNGITNTLIGNGEILSWQTPNAAGITVSGSAHILHFQNNDGSNDAAIELTVIGGSA